MATHDGTGWTTDSELVREFDRPVVVSEAVEGTICEAIEEWDDLSASTSLSGFVDLENLDGLFRTEAVAKEGALPSVGFQFQGCSVSVLYGNTVRVIVEREE